jgi:carbonic anhydrase
VRENARATAALLTRESTLLARRVMNGQLRIVAAEYALASGRVRFLED